MSQPERTSYPTEAALDRLVADKEAERLSLGRRLGQVVWRNIDLANLDPSMQEGGRGDTPDGLDDEDAATWKEQKVGKRRSAFLRFAVPADYEDSFGTPDWLPLTKRVDIILWAFDVDLPEDMGQSGKPDPVSEHIIRISLADESQYDASTEDRRREPYVAYYEDGSPLDAQNTETVIGILALMADRTENI